LAAIVAIFSAKRPPQASGGGPLQAVVLRGFAITINPGALPAQGAWAMAEAFTGPGCQRIAAWE
jgi:hypothetical protein